MSHTNREWKVTSRELSQKLDVEHRRLGIVVESEFWWVLAYGEWWIKTNEEINKLTYSEPLETYPALDTSELGELLPESILVRAIGEGEHGGRYWLYTQKESAFYGKNSGQTRIYEEIGDTEAEARGQLYLYLLQNGYVKGEGE